MGRYDSLKEINEMIVQKIFSSDREENSKYILMFLLRGLKEESALCRLLDDTAAEKLIFVLEDIEEDQDKAEMINSILNIMYDIEYDYNDKKSYIDMLLKSYLEIMDRGYDVKNNIKNTLFLFSVLGVEKNHLIYEIAKRYKEKQCIEIFSALRFDVSGIDIPEYPDIYYLMEREKKLSTRFGLLFHFYLLTEKDYVEHIEIAGTFFKIYRNYTTICADWAFSSQECFEHSYVKEGILSEEEEAIFIEIGDIYYNCISDDKISDAEENVEINLDEDLKETDFEEMQEKDMDQELEELFAQLSVAANKFALELRTEKIQKLLKRFFKGKTLFELAFCLPGE